LHLALAMLQVWPSASPYSVGTPEKETFAAEYPACAYPYQRFASDLAGSNA
jgi:hypothetical protein